MIPILKLLNFKKCRLAKQRTLRRRSVVTAPEVIRPLVHTTDEWWLACKETSPSIPSPHLDLAWTYLANNIPSPTWRTTFLHLPGEQHSFTYLENNIPSPTWRTTFLHLTWAWPGPDLDLDLDLDLELDLDLDLDLDFTWTWTTPGPGPGPGLHLDTRDFSRSDVS